MNGVWLLLLFITVIVVVILFFWLRRKNAHPRDQYSKLLLRARGDHALAERLIDLERQKHPTLQRTVLIRYAIERLERDNR